MLLFSGDVATQKEKALTKLEGCSGDRPRPCTAGRALAHPLCLSVPCQTGALALGLQLFGSSREHTGSPMGYGGGAGWWGGGHLSTQCFPLHPHTIPSIAEMIKTLPSS